MPDEREITEPVELCDARGRLNPSARGWARHPMLRANVRRAHGREKRWDTARGPWGEGAWGAQDLGRGIWPYANRWNWASSSGRATDGRLVGLQFGGKWMEGTGFTENALCIDGRVTKIHEELEWAYSWDDPTTRGACGHRAVSRWSSSSRRSSTARTAPT